MSGIVLLLIIVAIVVVFFFFREQANDILMGYIDWVEGHPLIGIFGFLFVNTILVPLLIPGTLLAIIGSFIYGMIYGKLAGFFIIFVIVVIANTAGGYLAFLNSRYLFYNSLKPIMMRYRYLRGMNRGL